MELYSGYTTVSLVHMTGSGKCSVSVGKTVDPVGLIHGEWCWNE